MCIRDSHETMQASDHIVDIGPGAGVHGGRICAQGTAKEIANSKDSITGQYLSGKREIEIPKKRKKLDKKRIVKLAKAEGHNLKAVNLELPLDLFVCITGVSGSGKSTLTIKLSYQQYLMRFQEQRKEIPKNLLSYQA